MREKHFILATAGHVDHGKSALVKALTGIDPDRLPEEKSRGITIELGFAHFQLPSPNESGESYHIGVIDVPGHEDFVKNMVAGVGAIDLALLVVAADDGWMPQTEEHLQILIYLGVQRIVVALTKTDLAKSIELVENEVHAQLRDSPFVKASIVKTSIANGRGLDELRKQLAREFSLLAPQLDLDKPRLFIDRAFSLRGVGTIVTGTLSGGKFQRGDSIVVQPTSLPARIRSLQNHNREVAEIGPGMRAALSLPDLASAHGLTDRGVGRGDVITRTNLGNANAIFDVVLTRSSRLAPWSHSLRHGARVRIHHGSGNFSARIFLRNNDSIAAGETKIAELRCESPIFAFVGDRFVVRDSSERQTIGGGIVLDADANAKNFRTPEQKLFLQNRADGGLDVRTLVETQLARDHVISRSKLLTKSCFNGGEISAALQSLAADGRIVLRGDLAADAQYWNSAIAKAFAAIDAEHKTHPHHTGLDLAHLRSLFAKEASEIFDQLVADLCERGAVCVADMIKHAAHRPTLPPRLQAAGTKIRSALAAKPFDPPSRKELAPDSLSQQALRFFLDTGELAEVSAEVVVSSEALQRMRDAVVEFIRRHGSASVGELRQALGSSRRVMVPFLELLDRDGVTRRVGDKRTLAR